MPPFRTKWRKLRTKQTEFATKSKKIISITNYIFYNLLMRLFSIRRQVIKIPENFILNFQGFHKYKISYFIVKQISIYMIILPSTEP